MPQFDDIPGDAIDGAETMTLIGLSQGDLDDQLTFSKVKDIIEFFKGRIDKGYVIQRVLKPGVDKVEHLWGYVRARREHEDIVAKIQEIKSNFDSLSSQKKIKEDELSRYEK